MGCLAMVLAGFRLLFLQCTHMNLPFLLGSRIVGFNPLRVQARTLRVSHTAASLGFL